MIPAKDENVENIAHSSNESILSTSLKVFGLISGFGLIISALFVVPQILAIGFSAAWNQYHSTWINALLLIIGLGAVLTFGFLYLFPAIDSAIRKKIPRKVREWIANIALVTTAVGLVVGGIIAIGSIYYERAKQSQNKFLELNSEEASAIAGAVHKQSESLRELSNQAGELLDQLSATEELIQDNKKRLTTTLTDIAKQVNAVEEANKNMASLVERQNQIELRATELERILDGQSPITKKDLDSASKWGWIQGILTSLIATGFLVLGKISFTKLRAAKSQKKSTTPTVEESDQ